MLQCRKLSWAGLGWAGHVAGMHVAAFGVLTCGGKRRVAAAGAMERVAVLRVHPWRSDPRSLAPLRWSRYPTCSATVPGAPRCSPRRLMPFFVKSLLILSFLLCVRVSTTFLNRSAFFCACVLHARPICCAGVPPHAALLVARPELRLFPRRIQTLN
jgi:hypothetical protein